MEVGMSRLFYEADPARQKDFLRKGPGGGAATTKSYLEKVAKLVPSEVIIGFLTIVGFIPLIRFSSLQMWFLWGAFLLGLMLTPIYLNFQAEKGKPKKLHLGISTIAFMAWAYATSGEKMIPQLYDPAIGSIVLVVFSLISGAVPLRR
jgi:hypothetical protein